MPLNIGEADRGVAPKTNRAAVAGSQNESAARPAKTKRRKEVIAMLDITASSRPSNTRAQCDGNSDRANTRHATTTLAAPDKPQILRPFWLPESESTAEAALALGRSERTARSLAARFDLGRKFLGGQWRISKVARAMYADGDMTTLARYLRGDRCSESVVAYYRRYVDPLPPWLPTSTENDTYRK